MVGGASGHSESLASLSGSPQTKAGQKLQHKNYSVYYVYLLPNLINKNHF